MHVWNDCNRLNWLTTTSKCHVEDRHEDIMEIFRHRNVPTNSKSAVFNPERDSLFCEPPETIHQKNLLKGWLNLEAHNDLLLGWLCPRG